MKVYVYVELDTGGRITISGNDLTAEDVSETFKLLAHHTVTSVTVEDEAIDMPPPGKGKTDPKAGPPL